MAREELYRQFGPKILEAFAKVLLDEINIVRAAAALPARDIVQVQTAIETKLLAIPDYDWQV